MNTAWKLFNLNKNNNVNLSKKKCKRNILILGFYDFTQQKAAPVSGLELLRVYYKMKKRQLL